MLDDYKDIQIKNSILKSKEALEDAIFSFNNNRFSMSLNRIYYAIFYSVLALAFKNDFITSKHLQLKGWFNKKFIYDEKIFNEQMLKIYQKAYNDRQESDYELIKPAEADKESIKNSIDDAKFFTENIFRLIEE